MSQHQIKKYATETLETPKRTEYLFTCYPCRVRGSYPTRSQRDKEAAKHEASISLGKPTG